MRVRIIAEAGGVRIAVKVVPGASRDRIVGQLGEALKIAVSKPPQGGAANAAVVALLAESLGLPPQRIAIVQGHANPRKQVSISGITADALKQRLGLA